ncbi:ribosomal P2 domain-containing protein [Calcarisporiella thermophila]|uniref:ribosomal P2 domain-containing protein n=1 Tax=Calcarisporiella thermophila TaxID=911321 RepID=UPI003744AD6A
MRRGVPPLLTLTPYISRTRSKMRHLAAYMLLTLGGNASPSAEDIKSILSTVGIEAEEERLNQLLSELAGKDLNELIAQGKEKLASVPTGGAAVASSGAAASGGAAAAAEEKKEEKKEEEEEEDEDMGFGLFD